MMFRRPLTNRYNINGYFLFRKEVQSKLRADGKRLSDSELKVQCDDLWKHLEETEKEVWKNKAREELRQFRSEAASRIVTGTDKTPPPFSGPPSFCPRQNTSRIKQESVLQARENEKLASNLEKRRLNDRKSFENAFTWKYETDKDALKRQKFYLISSNVLHNCPNGDCLPAEISCVEFTLESGITQHFCVPIKATHHCITLNMQEEIRDLSQKTHRFTTDDLQVIGKSCQDVAARLIEMSHDREPSCRNIRFFVLNWELEQTAGVLTYMLKNADIPEKYKCFNIQDLALIDDLAYGMFKFYDVDYPKLSPGSEAVEMGYLSDLIDGSLFRQVVCDVHDAYDDGAICCLSQLYLHVEMIRRSVEMKNFGVQFLSEYASGADSVKLHYYTMPKSLRLEPIGGEKMDSSTNKKETSNQLDSNSDDCDEISEVNEIREELVEVCDDRVAYLKDDVDEPNELETSTDTLTTTPWIPCNPLTLRRPVLEEEPKHSVDQRKPFIAPYPYGNVFLRAPNTYSVQNCLPSGRRGFGRGTALTTEGQLFDRVSWMKILISKN